MTTVSDLNPAVGRAAVPNGSRRGDPENPGGARARVARASASVALSEGRKLVAGARGAWVWQETPPSLREVVATRKPAPDAVPGRSPRLRLVWLVWNHAVAVPATAVLYVLAWLLQHPARAGAATVVVGAVTLMWIK